MRNKGKFSKLVWLLLIVAFIAIAGGGCGGSSSGGGGGSGSGGDDEPGIGSAEELLTDGGGLKPDDAGLMTIFSIPGLEPSAVFPATLSADGGVYGQEIRLIPSMVYRSEPDQDLSSMADDDEDVSDDVYSRTDTYKLIGLSAGKRYTVEISKNRAEPIEFMPVIQVRKWGDEGTETESESGEVSLEPEPMVGEHSISELKSMDKSAVKELLIKDGYSEQDAGQIADMIANGDTDPGTDKGHAVVISDPHLAFDLSNYPEEDPGIIAATFVAPSAGDYELSISGIEDDGYLLCVYVEKGDETTGYGYPEIIKYEDGSLFTVDDQITLRRAVLEFNLSQEIELSDLDEIESDLEQRYLDKYGLPFAENILDGMGLPDPAKISAKGIRAADDDDDETPSQKKAYDKAAERLRPSKGQSSTIPLEVNDIRRIAKYTMRLGDTFDGVTGLKKTSYASAAERAVDYEDDDSDQNRSIQSPTAKSRIKLITTERENEEEMEVTTTAGIELAKFSIENKNRVQKSMKYGLTTATLMLKYVVCDSEYRTPKDGFALSQNAADYLDENGSSAFRKEFGDYFVSGVRYGGRFEAMVTITTETREQMKEIENDFNTKILAFSASNEFKKNIRNALKNSRIEITIYEEGGSNEGEGIELSAGDNDGLIDSMMNRFNNFVNASKGSDFKTVPVFYQLTRLRALNRTGIDEQIDVAPKALLASRKLLRTMMAIDAYYNVLNSIQQDNLVNAGSLKASWQKDYEKQEIADAELGDIFTSVEKMDARRATLEPIRNSFRVTTERWSFYKALLNEQKRFRNVNYAHENEKGGSRNNTKTWKWGLEDYSYSSAVHKNYIKAEEPEKFQAPWKFGWRHDWKPWHNRANIIAYHWITDYCECNHIINQGQNPTIGSHTVSWWFRGMGTQSVNWRWGARWFDLKPAEFPFRGLQG